MGKINVLEPQIANLIAAGEVVDRPASVVKEMLENSIDAGAKNIVIEIKRGGSSFIRVSDDGCGMSREDVPICIKRHATSKIKSAADLDGIMTLGFRGEALAAIGSVSTLRIMTKPHGEKMGTMLIAESGEIQQFTETGCMDGTTIIVENLFANIPARRKFLKKDASEAMAVTAVVEKLALSRPDLVFRFISDGAVKFATSGDGSLKNCIYAVLGREFAGKLTKVEALTEGIGVEGFIGTPENIRANRNYQNFFINGRYVKSRTAMAALEQAFSSYIPGDKFPVCVLSINIHPAFVDVNVHPAKLEVKFSNEQIVFEAVYSAVRGTLAQSLARPSSLRSKQEVDRENRALHGFVPIRDGSSSKGEQLRMEVRIDGSKDAPTTTPSPLAVPAGDEGEFSFPKKVDDFKPKPESKQTEVTPPLPLSIDPSADGDILSSIPTSENLAKDDRLVENDDPLFRFTVPKPPVNSKCFERSKNISSNAEDYPLSIPVISSLPKSSVEVIKENTENESDTKASDIDIEDNASSIDPTVISSQVSKTEGSVRTISSLNRSSAEEVTPPQYKMLGEVFNSYILAECDGKLLMIDKHAAHERILFEDMKKNMRGECVSQVIMIPLELTLSAAELAAVDEFKEQITACGYAYEPSSDGRSVSITQIPAFLDNDQAATLFVTMAGRLASGTGNVKHTRAEFYEQALYQASCKAAIKAGRIYDEAHLKWVCDRVLSNPEIRFCPHGRPVAFEITKNEIEHSFKRI